MAGRSEIVGSGIVRLKVDDAGAKRQISALKGHLTREMKQMGAQRASPTLDLNNDPFERELKKSLAQLRAASAKDAKMVLDIEDKKFKRKAKEIADYVSRFQTQAAKARVTEDKELIKSANRQLRYAQAVQKQFKQAEAAWQNQTAKIRQNIDTIEKYEKALAKQQAERQRRATNEFKIRMRELKEEEAARKRAIKERTALERKQQKILEDGEKRFYRQITENFKFEMRELAHRQKKEAEEQKRRVRQAQEQAAMLRAQKKLREEIDERIRRERASVGDLHAEYIDLHKTIEEYEQRRRRAFRAGGEAAAYRVEAERNRAIQRIREIEDRYREIDVKPVKVPVEFDSDRAFHRLRYTIQQVSRDTGRRGLFRGFRLFAQDEISHIIDRVDAFRKAFRETRVDIGIFSIRLSHLLMMLKILGPAVIETVAALGPLISVLGSGTLGLGALGVAIVGGAIPALAGFLGILVPTGKRLIDAVSAMNDAEQAIKKYGKGSEEAKEAQEELNDAMKGMAPETQRAAKQIMKLKNRWTDLTAPAQASLMRTIGDTIGYANENLGMFAKNTNTVTKTFETGIRGWLKGLNSIEGRNILGDMMDNFNKSIGPVLKGLGSLMTYLGRVGRVASNFLPGFARQFQDWAQGVADGAKNTADLTRRVTDAVDSLRAVGRFALAAGRFLKAFFSAGVGQGQTFLQTITDILNRWTEWAESDSGRRGIQSFFDRAIRGAKALIGFLANIAELVFRWADAISPFTTALLNIANIFGDLLNNALAWNSTITSIGLIGGTFFRRQIWGAAKLAAHLASLGTLFRGIGAAAGGGMLAGGLFGKSGKADEVKKLGAYAATSAASVGGLGKALQGVLKVIRSPVGKVGLVAALAAAVDLGSSLFKGFSKNSELNKFIYQGPTQFDRLKTSIANVGKESGILGKVFNTVFTNPLKSVGGVGADSFTETIRNITKAITDGSLGIADLTEKAQKHFEYAGNYAEKFSQDILIASDSMNDALNVTELTNQAQRRYNRAVENFGKNSTQARNAQIQLNDAQTQQYYATQQANQARRQAIQDSKDYVRQEKNALLLMEAMAYQAQASGRPQEEVNRMLADINRRRSALEQESAAIAVNAARMRDANAANREYLPLMGSTLGIIRKLSTELSQAQLDKLAIKFPRPEEAHRAFAAIRKAIEAGVPKKKAMNILLNASSAKKGIQELSRLLERVSRRRSVQVDTKAIDRASTKLQRFIGIKLTPKEMRLALRGDKEVIRKIARISGMKPKEIKQLIRAEVRKAENDIQKVENKTLNPKEAKISAPGAIEAAAQAANVADAIRSIPRSWTSTVTTHYKTTGTPPRGRAAGGFAPGYADGGVAGFAAGGSTGATPNDERIQRAAERAARSQTRDIRGGGRVTRPTYLTGEENRPEIIISTNPRYRERNLGLLRMAARALSVGEMLRGERPPEENTIISASNGGGAVVKGGFGKGKKNKNFYYPTPKLRKRPPRMKKKFGKAKKKKLGRAWAAHIDYLQRQRSDWEREVSIRDSQVQEPEHLVIESNKPIMVPNPDKPGTTMPLKDEDGNQVNEMVVNHAGMAKYKEGLDRVQEAINKLMQILRQLVSAIPMASQALRQERGVRRNRIRSLNAALRKEEDMARDSDASDKQRSEARKQAAKIKKQIRQEEKIVGDIGSDLSSYGEERKDAGFSLREWQIEKRQNRAEYNRTAVRASKDADEENKQRVDQHTDRGGGSPSGGTGGLSIGEQRAAAAGEMRSVLASYGSQAQQGGASAVAGAMRGGGVMGGLGSVAAAVAGGVSGGGFGGIAGTGGGLGSAVSGGATASSMLGPVSSGGGFGTMAAGVGGIMGGVGGDKITTVNVTNNFQEPPADPHTWSAGLEFELGTI
jgi:hypothetical protein